ncbi:PAN domain-containing protein [Rhizobium sp. PP-F2F-G20b]|nr:PAN domain-containing protein [Rhizobium sp. PP-F2F-G20b]
MRAKLRLLAGLVALLSCVLAIPTARSADRIFGPFSIEEANPTVIKLNGEIDAGTALNFRRALQAAPSAKLLTLNSPGGAVQMALLIADDVASKGISTFIPKGSECYSACAYIFLAGVERLAEGALGVHQISSDTSNLVSAQMSISDIIDVLNRFETPVEVMTWMFKTPPDEMHVFTAEEIAKYKINRKRGAAPVSPATPASSSTASSEAQPPLLPGSDSSIRTLEANPSGSNEAHANANLSAIDEFASRPTRMALYAGLDFFGNDLSAQRVSSAGECAKACLSLRGSCKAFTFNSNPKIVEGNNCYLKSSKGRADGNAVAISGTFLSSLDPDPKDFTIAIIDPTNALFKDVDLPGGDLTSRPSQVGQTAQQCRLACIDELQCVAFTFVKKKKECWLKGKVGTPTFKPGLVTGAKKLQSYSAAEIISLR